MYPLLCQRNVLRVGLAWDADMFKQQPEDTACIFNAKVPGVTPELCNNLRWLCIYRLFTGFGYSEWYETTAVAQRVFRVSRGKMRNVSKSLYPLTWHPLTSCGCPKSSPRDKCGQWKVVHWSVVSLLECMKGNLLANTLQLFISPDGGSRLCQQLKKKNFSDCTC